MKTNGSTHAEKRVKANISTPILRTRNWRLILSNPRKSPNKRRFAVRNQHLVPRLAGKIEPVVSGPCPLAVYVRQSNVLKIHGRMKSPPKEELKISSGMWNYKFLSPNKS